VIASEIAVVAVVAVFLRQLLFQQLQPLHWPLLPPISNII
jgi:hypothetical protein